MSILWGFERIQPWGETDMKTLKATVLFLALAATAFAGDAWLDLENCDMCKNMMTDAELFEAMTWETHVLKNGLLEVTTYPAAMEDRFDQLMEKMEKSGARVMAGEKLEMCGMCRSYGAMMMKGVDMDQIETEGGVVTVISSSDPDVVAMIQKHAQTTIDEYAAWQSAEGGHGHEHGHEHGHDHGHDHAH